MAVPYETVYSTVTSLVVLFVFLSTTCIAGCPCAVCLSVCNVGWFVITWCNKKSKLAYDRIGQCFGYLHAKANPNCNII